MLPESWGRPDSPRNPPRAAALRSSAAPAFFSVLCLSRALATRPGSRAVAASLDPASCPQGAMPRSGRASWRPPPWLAASLDP